MRFIKYDKQWHVCLPFDVAFVDMLQQIENHEPMEGGIEVLQALVRMFVGYLGDTIAHEIIHKRAKEEHYTPERMQSNRELFRVNVLHVVSKLEDFIEALRNFHDTTQRMGVEAKIIPMTDSVHGGGMAYKQIKYFCSTARQMLHE